MHLTKSSKTAPSDLHKARQHQRRAAARFVVVTLHDLREVWKFFDFDAVPMVSKAQVKAVAAGDAWLATAPTCSSSAHPAAAKP